LDDRLQRRRQPRRERRAVLGRLGDLGAVRHLPIQASHVREELVIVHNVDIEGGRDAEKDDFDYAFDFKQVFRPLKGGSTFTRDVS
jgi:hypothetical protein